MCQHGDVSVKSFNKLDCVPKLQGGESEVEIRFDRVRGHFVVLCQYEWRVELISCERRDGTGKSCKGLVLSKHVVDPGISSDS